MSYLTRTGVSSSNGGQFNTISFWFKRNTNLTHSTQSLFGAQVDGNNYTWVRFNNSQLQYISVTGGSIKFKLQTSAIFEDPSAWYHVVLRSSTTSGTSSNRIRMYINGSQVTDFDTETYPDQNYFSYLCDNNTDMFVGKSSGVYSGLLADLNLLDGEDQDANKFGETDATTGIWKPKPDFTGINYGNNGFRLQFKTSGNMGLDTSGQSHNFTNSSVDAQAQSTDTPSNSFCTWNRAFSNNNLTVVYDGGLRIEESSSNAWRSILCTLAVSKGKWYWEFKVGPTGDSQYFIMGASRTDVAYNSYVATNNQGPFRAGGGYAMQTNGTKINNNSSASYGSAMGSNSIIGCRLDLDNGTIGFIQGGSDLGNAYTGLTTGDDIFYTPFASIGQADNGEDARLEINTGNPVFTDTANNADANGFGKFVNSVPSGYYSLCTKNIESLG
tara:strand:- start:1837 stop:3159 length:1323 start_codon:yes stop_codon:yes gene_type:complete